VMVEIRQQPIAEAEFLGERAVVFDGIVAHSKYHAAAASKIGGSITEPVSLHRSTRGVGLRIKPEEHIAALLISQAGNAAVVRRQ